VASQAAVRLPEGSKPQRMVLVGPSTQKQAMAHVPADTVVVHGEIDDVVPLSATFEWARPQALPVIVLPGVGHFFHGQLGLLKSVVVQELTPRMPL
jgi:alpha/beta superfamily hydrolase